MSTQSQSLCCIAPLCGPPTFSVEKHLFPEDEALKTIIQVAQELGLSIKNVESYGNWKAKISLDALGASHVRGRGKLVLVTAMTPTPHGEGKTVTSIGLSMGLEQLGHSSVACLRQPSLGPVFGLKGGATGGGLATVEPSQDINMGFTGDIDRVATAHNLLAAIVGNHLFYGNELGIDPRKVTWPHSFDMEDRALRQIVIGLGQKSPPREDAFIITAASELMAILSLSRDYSDLKERLSRVIVGYTRDDRPVRAAHLRVVGAMAAVLREAFKPNLVQTSEGTPALVHGGCFGNIAHGTTSLVSILLGLQQAEYCIVEAGFGSELGAEKFVDIVARTGGLNVDSAVVVASIRALKHHGGAPGSTGHPGQVAVKKGLDNLEKHIENVRMLGLTPVVAVNKFPTDTREELDTVGEYCDDQDVPWAISTAFENGGRGAVELSERVIEASGRGSVSKPLYPLEASIDDKLETVVRTLYGGAGVDFTLDARVDIKRIVQLGLAREPVCVAKTPLSLSDDHVRIGRPRGFTATVRKLFPAAGAGFNIAYMGDIVAMPGLPKHPAAELIDLTADGSVKGIL